MSIRALKIERFRCLSSVEFDADSSRNVIVGENGAGKTSVLEALFFLGRGRSFRPGTAATLIADGSADFTLFAELESGGSRRKVGVRQGSTGLTVHIDGEAGGGVADLVSLFPVQVIEPEIHELVQGGPKGRRRFLDWGVFHVKHEFFPQWKRYRRALQQRNHALRQGFDRATVTAWDSELVGAGDSIDALRREFLNEYEPILEDISGGLLGEPVACRYRSGWAMDHQFATALDASWDRDVALGRTNVGPHRAELILEVDRTPARNRLSRGQQKLLGISLVLAQARFVAESIGQDVTLLVDEPAAELDEPHLAALVEVLFESRAQLFISALDLDALPIKSPARVFHVERGTLVTLI